MVILDELILGAFVLMNVITFITFGYDKKCARTGERRVPEARLVGLSAALGIVGGWVGMQVFRHKTRKLWFQIRMVLATFLNVVWVWMYFRWKGWA